MDVLSTGRVERHNLGVGKPIFDLLVNSRYIGAEALSQFGGKFAPLLECIGEAGVGFGVVGPLARFSDVVSIFSCRTKSCLDVSIRKELFYSAEMDGGPEAEQQVGVRRFGL